MTKKIIIFLAISLFTLSFQSWAGSEKKFTKEDIKQFMTNNSFSFMDMDVVNSIFALTALRNGENLSVVEFFEFQLDIIVCESWKIKDKLNKPSSKRAMELLWKIKDYRQENPRRTKNLRGQV